MDFWSTFPILFTNTCSSLCAKSPGSTLTGLEGINPKSIFGGWRNPHHNLSDGGGGKLTVSVPVTLRMQKGKFRFPSIILVFTHPNSSDSTKLLTRFDLRIASKISLTPPPPCGCWFGFPRSIRLLEFGDCTIWSSSSTSSSSLEAKEIRVKNMRVFRPSSKIN